MSEKTRYVALLRGINVGGHHKVPMGQLRDEMEKISCEDVVTILNTGNIIFSATPEPIEKIQQKLKKHLEAVFGFAIPVLVRTASTIATLFEQHPFEAIAVTKETRLYVSFLMDPPEIELSLPWISEDKGYQILEIRENSVYSVLDLGISKTPKGMEALERLFGKNTTTRNWNTLKRILAKLP
ncbi:DUF1697 domain-containing protein [Spongiimicrobium salis]|uniref:DUF1697 domain-containing protein n=1 Tax=Spongiimicrobium salis TaxID=1667022 RepID=UPI00374CC783